MTTLPAGRLESTKPHRDYSATSAAYPEARFSVGRIINELIQFAAAARRDHARLSRT
jgi:hypothetical protein